jgi:hypothetical protein
MCVDEGQLRCPSSSEADVDLSESEARRIFELNETKDVRRIQAAMLEAVGAKK